MLHIVYEQKLETDVDNQPSVLVLHLRRKIISALVYSLLTVIFPDECSSHGQFEELYATPKICLNMKHSNFLKHEEL